MSLISSTTTRRLQLACISHFIRDICAALRAPFPVSISAQLLFHRFYANIVLSKFCPVWTAGAAVLLATKLHDTPHSLRQIACVLYDRLRARENNRAPISNPVILEGTCYTRPLDFYGAQGYEWKRSLIAIERELLKQVGFRVETDAPHKLVLVFVNAMRENGFGPSWGQKGRNVYQELLQLAWNYANDILASDICVIELAQDVACGCISMAMRKCPGQLPKGWQIAFGSNEIVCERIENELEKIYEIGDTRGRMLDYSGCELFQWLHPINNMDKEQNEHDTDMTDAGNGKRKRKRFDCPGLSV